MRPYDRPEVRAARSDWLACSWHLRRAREALEGLNAEGAVAEATAAITAAIETTQRARAAYVEALRAAEEAEEVAA